MRRIVIYYYLVILDPYTHFMSSAINIIVNKLWKMHWKIIDNTIIKKILSTTTEEEITNSRLYKVTHTLKNKGHLIGIKKNCFLCINPNKTIDEEEIIQLYYRELLRKHCQKFIMWGRYIWGVKALELHLQNYEIPENIDIINTHKNALEVIMFDRTVSYKRYTNKQVDIFSKIKKYLVTHKIGKFNFMIAPLELAILESLHNPSQIQNSLITEYIKKIVRKNKKTINIDFFAIILNYSKHHVGVNRLYQISKSIDPTFANELYNIIKKHSFIIQA